MRDRYLAEITFDPGTRRFAYGSKPCTACGRNADVAPGFKISFPLIDCTKCKGTGRRGNGKCRACVTGFGGRPAGKVSDYAHPYADGPCPTCAGTDRVPAIPTDSVPDAVMADLLAVCPVKVYPKDRDLSWAENHLGMLMIDGLPMALWSIVDYGKAWGMCADARSTTELAVKVAEKLLTDSPQACKLTDDQTGTVVDHIAVFLARNGYSVVGIPAARLVPAEVAP